MTDSLLINVEALREKAWAEVIASKAYLSFKALDVAVVSMGGTSLLRESASLSELDKPTLPKTITVRRRKRPSQADIAFRCLREKGEPLHIRDLMKLVTQSGVAITGENPLANFRSTLSRDDRFRSVMKDGGYFWWLVASPIPISWKEAENPDLLSQSSASDSSS